MIFPRYAELHTDPLPPGIEGLRWQIPPTPVWFPPLENFMLAATRSWPNGAEALKARKDADASGLQKNREAFEAIVAVLVFADGGLSRIRLLPVDLDFDSKDASRGRPQLASPGVAMRIIARAAARSARFATKIRYVPDENISEVVLR